MTIPQEAIEAAAVALTHVTGEPRVGRFERTMAAVILTAALPALERQIRDQVAQEIVTAAADTYGTTVLDARMFEGQWDAIKLAAKIARGKDHA